MPAAGTLPAVLRKECLTAAVRLYDSEMWNRFPCQEVFGSPIPYSEEELVIDTVKVLRKTGAWHSQPHSADPVELTQYARKLCRALYQSAKFPITANQMAQLRDVEDGELNGSNLSMADLRRKTERYIDREIRRRIAYLRRTLEALCIQTLTQQNFNVTVDGALQAVDWGVQNVTASAAWTVNTTDIAGDFQGFLKAFKLQAGSMPNKILVGPDLYADMLAANDTVRDFYIQNPEFIRGDLGKEVFTRSSDQRYQVIENWGQSENTPGAPADMWPANKMVMINDAAESDPFEMATVRTFDNDLNGGLFSYTYESPDPKSLDVVITHNGLPIIRDATQILICDLA